MDPIWSVIPGKRPGRQKLRVLLAATVVMAAVVVTINRVLSPRLYALASSSYKLEARCLPFGIRARKDHPGDIQDVKHDHDVA